MNEKENIFNQNHSDINYINKNVTCDFRKN